MKILVLADALAWHTQRYVAELKRQGHAVTLVSFQDGEGVDVVLAPSKYSNALSYMTHVIAIKVLIDTYKVDIVNAHFASAYGVMAARCRRRYGDCGASWALTVWGSDILVSPGKSWLHKKRVAYALNSADTILADSSYLAKKTATLTDRPVDVILWGIERSHCANDAALRSQVERFCQRRSNGMLKLIMPRPHRVLYANETLLSGIAPLLRSGRAIVTVNSTGSMLERFFRHAEALGVCERIREYQPCSRDEYLNLLREHDCYLSAATSDSSPVSQIEAQACGALPVCVEHPGLEDLLSEQTRKHCIYGRDDTNGALKTIERLCALDEESLFALLCANRDIVRQNAIYEDNIAETVSVFERLCRQS